MPAVLFARDGTRAHHQAEFFGFRFRKTRVIDPIARGSHIFSGCHIVGVLDSRPVSPTASSNWNLAMDTITNTNLPTAEPAADPQQQAQAQLEHEGRLVQELFPAAVLASLVGKKFGTSVSVGGFKAYADNIAVASADPKNPNESMLSQQLVWAHHHIGCLLGKAANAETPELVAVYNAATTKLMAEFRKSSLALHALRSPAGPKQLTVVTGNQQVAMIDNEPSNRASTEKSGDNELGGNQARLSHVKLDSPFSAYGTTDCREAEPVEMQGVHARGSRKAQGNGAEESPLAILNRSDNAGR
jgi:hypothetical protein